MDRVRVELLSKEETIAFGKDLASFLQPGTVLALSGDLGAGKTTFVQGLAVGLGIPDPIQSPTFIYCNQYEGLMTLFHFDLYRLKGEKDFLNLGFEEYLDAKGVCAIEWPERIPSLLPDNTWHLSFSHLNRGRLVEIQKQGAPL